MPTIADLDAGSVSFDLNIPSPELLRVEQPLSSRFGNGNDTKPTRSHRRHHDRLYAAIDLGTNNCRLLIAEPHRDHFRVVDAFSRIVRLGEGLSAHGVLSEAAQARAIAALSICADKLRKRNIRLARHVATQACRQAKNCMEFVARTYEETGLHLDVITPSEEARLAVLGCQGLLDPAMQHALIFDIGGGSTELVLVRQDAKKAVDILGWISIPLGVVSLAEVHGGREVSPEAYAAMKADVRRYLDRFAILDTVDHGSLQILGTSGTVTTLASLHLGLDHYDRSKVDGCTVPTHVLTGLAQSLMLSSYEARVAQGCIGRERADLVIAGCAILEAIIETFQDTPATANIQVADRGIREGVLRTLMLRDKGKDWGKH